MCFLLKDRANKTQSHRPPKPMQNTAVKQSDIKKERYAIWASTLCFEGTFVPITFSCEQSWGKCKNSLFWRSAPARWHSWAVLSRPRCRFPPAASLVLGSRCWQEIPHCTHIRELETAWPRALYRMAEWVFRSDLAIASVLSPDKWDTHIETNKMYQNVPISLQPRDVVGLPVYLLHGQNYDILVVIPHIICYS